MSRWKQDNDAQLLAVKKKLSLATAFLWGMQWCQATRAQFKGPEPSSNVQWGGEGGDKNWSCSSFHPVKCCLEIHGRRGSKKVRKQIPIWLKGESCMQCPFLPSNAASWPSTVLAESSFPCPQANATLKVSGLFTLESGCLKYKEHALTAC